MVSVRKLAHKNIPDLPCELIADSIVGPKYDLSLVFIGTRRARNLNIKYRAKDTIPNVLSFPLTDNSGEIFITPAVAGQNNVLYMFIHALFHLKGMEHGNIMESRETEALEKWHEKLLLA